MELPPEKVFIAQKWMVEKANLAAKPVMIATSILTSMNKASRPRRSEAADLVNAVLDGTDCIMLGEETATGNDPVQMVEVTAKICAEAEKTINYKRAYNDIRTYTPTPIDTAESVASACCSAVLD